MTGGEGSSAPVTIFERLRMTPTFGLTSSSRRSVPASNLSLIMGRTTRRTRLLPLLLRGLIYPGTCRQFIASRAPGLTQHDMLRRSQFKQVKDDEFAEGVARQDAGQFLDGFEADEVSGDVCAKDQALTPATVVLFAAVKKALERKLVFGIRRAGDRAHLVTEITWRLERMNRRP